MVVQEARAVLVIGGIRSIRAYVATAEQLDNIDVIRGQTSTVNRS